MLERFSRAEVLKIQRPSRYVGGEVNAIRKSHDEVAVTIALCCPDTYEIGMSHYGYLLLYHILNDLDWAACERAFAPWVDMADLMRRRDVPLWTLESERPVREFDVIGFSVNTELAATTVLEMLDLSGLPLRSAGREAALPLVLGGGCGLANPEPFAPFFDAIFLGEADEGFVEIAETARRAKEENWEKRRLLEALSRVEGAYVPSLHASDGERPRVRRRILKDLSRSALPRRPLIPTTQPIHDRLTAEVSRGCTVGCRFCQAGFWYRPTREKSPEPLYRQIYEALDESGYEGLSLLSLSVTDYSALDCLLEALSDRIRAERLDFSLPSLRVGRVSASALATMSESRRTGLTVAPEAGTERLRRVINKPVTDSDVLETAEMIFSRGWLSLKLYFMLGLPTETDEDVAAMVRLIAKVSDAARRRSRRARVRVSVSPLVPKPHTPFQWEPLCDADVYRRRIDILRRGLRRLRNVHLRWQDIEISRLETLLARGDGRVADAVEAAWRRGARFDSWSDRHDPSLWDEVVAACGLKWEDYLGEISEEATLPWDFVETGVPKSYLLRERRLSRREEPTPNCREAGCGGCGVCGLKPGAPYPQNLLAEPTRIRPIRKGPPRYSGVVFRYRALCTKTGRAALLGHLEMKAILERAFRRAGLPLRFSEGHNPEPRFSFGQPVPLEVESTAEVFDVELTEPVDGQRLSERVNRHLPEGMVLYQVKMVAPKAPSLGAALSGIVYRVDLTPVVARLGRDEVENRIRRFMASDEVPFEKERKGRVRKVNMREFVREASLQDNNRLELSVRVIDELQIKAKFLLGRMLEIDEDEVLALRIRKVRNVLRRDARKERR